MALILVQRPLCRRSPGFHSIKRVSTHMCTVYTLMHFVHLIMMQHYGVIRSRHGSIKLLFMMQNGGENIAALLRMPKRRANFAIGVQR